MEENQRRNAREVDKTKKSTRRSPRPQTRSRKDTRRKHIPKTERQEGETGFVYVGFRSYIICHRGFLGGHEFLGAAGRVRSDFLIIESSEHIHHREDFRPG